MTTYVLSCTHHADVPGPAGATTGRAWCDVCNESRPVVGFDWPDNNEHARAIWDGLADCVACETGSPSPCPVCERTDAPDA